MPSTSNNAEKPSSSVLMRNRRSTVLEKRGALPRSRSGIQIGNGVTTRSSLRTKRSRLSTDLRPSSVTGQPNRTLSESTENNTTETESRMVGNSSLRNSPLRDTPPVTPRNGVVGLSTSHQRATDHSNSLSPPNPAHENNRGNDRPSFSLTERRRSRAISNEVQDTILPGDSQVASISAAGSPQQFNRMKAYLAEAVSEKRTMRAALDLANEKCVQQEKENKRLSQQINALEQMISKPNSKGRRSSKKGTWSNEDDKSVIAPYKGIRLQLDMIINAEATLLVTESTFTTNGKNRVQDWTGAATILDCDENNPPKLSVNLPDGTIAIPKCTMLRCFAKKFYNDRFNSTTAFVRHVTKKILVDSKNFGMNDEEKDDCIDKMSCYPPVLSKCRTALREETNNCKQGARNTFLKGLCYRKALLGEVKNSSVENESRSKEKHLVYERCVKTLTGTEVDTMYWRTTPYALLYNIDTDEQETAEKMIVMEQDSISNGKVDNLFMNEAARLAFHRLRGYSIPEESGDEYRDTSIIWLARADAWITTAMMNIKGNGKGGTHSNEFLQKYERLLPKALERIIKDIWEDVIDLSPEEIKTSIPGHEGDDPYANEIRKYTYVQKSLDDGYLYLLVTPKYIAENVCSWIGCIKDCQIGRCTATEEKFVRIVKDIDFRELEESDLEEELDSDEGTIAGNMRQGGAGATGFPNTNGSVTQTEELGEEPSNTVSVDERNESGSTE